MLKNFLKNLKSRLVFIKALKGVKFRRIIFGASVALSSAIITETR